MYHKQCLTDIFLYFIILIREKKEKYVFSLVATAFIFSVYWILSRFWLIGLETVKNNERTLPNHLRL